MNVDITMPVRVHRVPIENFIRARRDGLAWIDTSPITTICGVTGAWTDGRLRACMALRRCHKKGIQ